MINKKPSDYLEVKVIFTFLDAQSPSLLIKQKSMLKYNRLQHKQLKSQLQFQMQILKSLLLSKESRLQSLLLLILCKKVLLKPYILKRFACFNIFGDNNYCAKQRVTR